MPYDASNQANKACSLKAKKKVFLLKAKKKVFSLKAKRNARKVIAQVKNFKMRFATPPFNSLMSFKDYEDKSSYFF